MSNGESGWCLQYLSYGLLADYQFEVNIDFINLGGYKSRELVVLVYANYRLA